jgi:hypothetical protein
LQCCGESAGGHLCALIGLTADDKQYQPGFEQADCSVQGPFCDPLSAFSPSLCVFSFVGVVDFYGVHDFTDSSQHYATRDGLPRLNILFSIILLSFQAEALHCT